jgi:hypothetical protein
MHIRHGFLNGILVLIAALGISACASWDYIHPSPRSIEGWLSSSTPSHAWAPIEPDRMIPLPPESVPPAAGMLRSHAAVQLDPDRFGQLVPGRAWPSQTGRVPYLVRGVALDEPRGSVRVLEHDDELLVQYEGPPVRARAIAMPVIVLLPAAPTKLYVKISLFD